MFSFGRVLVVDDSPMMRAVLKKSLVMAKIQIKEVVECGDGTEVLDVLKKHEVDLMFCDLNMPKLNGDDLIRSFPDHPELQVPPIVVVSSEASDERVTALSSKDIIGVIRKPFTPEKLVGILSNHLQPN